MTTTDSPEAQPQGVELHRFQRGGHRIDQMCRLCNQVADAPIHQMGDIEREIAKADELNQKELIEAIAAPWICVEEKPCEETVAVHWDELITALAAVHATPRATADTFQSRVDPWLQHCFGPQIAADVVERNHRFLEEALELVQALGCTQSEAHQLVEYVFNRDLGNAAQEVGGVMVTLAALCLANGLDMHVSAESELERIWTKTEVIRAKQAAKPQHSPLPAAPCANGETTVEAWQPIQTCPDNTTVMFWDNGLKIGRMEHDTLRMGGFKQNHFWGGPFDDDVPPSHWMPLPEPPCMAQVRAAAQTNGESGEE